MYDTIGAYYPFASDEDRDAVADRIGAIRGVFDVRTGEVLYRSGRLRNFSVRVGQRRLWVCGSLQKFLHGNNAGSVLTLAEVGTALTGVSAELGLPFDAFALHRLDVGVTVPVSRPIREYSARFVRLGGCKRDSLRDGQTVLFGGGEYQFTLYDKKAECGGVCAVELLAYGSELMRLELRMVSRLAERVAFSPLVGSLRKPDAMRECATKFLDVYGKIEKACDAGSGGDAGSSGVTAASHRKALAVAQYRSNPAHYRQRLQSDRERYPQKERQRIRKEYDAWDESGGSRSLVGEVTARVGDAVGLILRGL